MVFQSVVAPNGLIVYPDGPWPGRRHVAGIFTNRRLIEALTAKMQDLGKVFTIYSDPAYPVSQYLDGPFRKTTGQLTEYQIQYNTDMSACRTCVECAFEKIVTQFAFFDYQKNLRVLHQPFGKYYAVAALLTNRHTTLYGNQTETFLGLIPPDLEEYLENRRIEHMHED